MTKGLSFAQSVCGQSVSEESAFDAEFFNLFYPNQELEIARLDLN